MGDDLIDIFLLSANLTTPIACAQPSWTTTDRSGSEGRERSGVGCSALLGASSVTRKPRLTDWHTCLDLCPSISVALDDFTSGENFPIIDS